MARNDARNTARNRFSIRIAAVFFIACGLIVALVFLLQANRESRAMSWPTVEGIVSSSTYFVSGVGPKEKADWKYTYSYTVGGKTYRGGSDVYRTGYSGPAKLNQNEKSTYESYPPGTSITVRYDESDPSRSYFGPGPSWANYAMPIGGGVLLIGLGVFTWRKARAMAREAKGLIASPVNS